MWQTALEHLPFSPYYLIRNMHSLLRSDWTQWRMWSCAQPGHPAQALGRHRAGRAHMTGTAGTTRRTDRSGRIHRRGRTHGTQIPKPPKSQNIDISIFFGFLQTSKGNLETLKSWKIGKSWHHDKHSFGRFRIQDSRFQRPMKSWILSIDKSYFFRFWKSWYFEILKSWTFRGLGD